MAYKWKPSKSQRREFAIRMQDVNEQQAYKERKELKAEKRRQGSKFDYYSAGGNYIPTEFQYQEAMSFLLSREMTPEQKEACNQVLYGFSCQEKIHHDYIHIVNDMTRKRVEIPA